MRPPNRIHTVGQNYWHKCFRDGLSEVAKGCFELLVSKEKLQAKIFTLSMRAA